MKAGTRLDSRSRTALLDTSPAPRRPRILVVDDDPAVLTLVCRILTGPDYEVVSAGSVADATAVSEAHGTAPFDLLLTDVVLPGSKGPALAARLRCTWKEARVVYMSGYDRESVARHGVAAEDHFVPKPFTPRSLRAAVDRAMAARGAS